jgi:hypothetical protein
MMTWSAVDRAVNNRFTVVSKYQVFLGERPYHAVAFTPGTGNLVEELTAFVYLHEGVTGILINYFYIERDANMVGLSADSKRVGRFSFQLVPGRALI